MLYPYVQPIHLMISPIQKLKEPINLVYSGPKEMHSFGKPTISSLKPLQYHKALKGISAFKIPQIKILLMPQPKGKRSERFIIQFLYYI
jgi:hypothetical protein